MTQGLCFYQVNQSLGRNQIRNRMKCYVIGYVHQQLVYLKFLGKEFAYFVLKSEAKYWLFCHL